jgi:chromosomal replication initiation ATPase DnaA
MSIKSHHQIVGLAPLVPAFYRAPRTSKSVILRAASLTGYAPKEITGVGRTAPLARVRFAIMLVLRRRGLSLPEIGRRLGGRDHTTVMHGVERAEAMLSSDADFAALFDQIAVL